MTEQAEESTPPPTPEITQAVVTGVKAAVARGPCMGFPVIDAHIQIVLELLAMVRLFNNYFAFVFSVTK